VQGAVLSAMALGAPGALPVAMLHGLVNGNMASWYAAAALPLSATHRVLLYDLRGHGGSTLPASGFDLASHAADLDCVLAHYSYAEAPVDLVGYSMGALIALHFALRQPLRVRRLVLVDAPMPAITHVAPSLHGLADDPDAYLAASGLSGRRRERLRQRIGALLRATTLVKDVCAMQAEPDHLLAGFRRPVLLIYGTRSPCRAAGEALARVLPCCSLSWLEAGHDLPAQAPALLCRDILQFLSGAESSARRIDAHSEAV
jgi:pimeloyl-ACP methyl ester carboxylesterase